MTITLSDRVKRIKPSPTLAVNTRAAELKAEGRDIISLGVGEPDFNTPDHIIEAAIQALYDGYTRYTPVDGLPILKQSIIAKFSRDNLLQYKPNQILVSCGGKQSFFNLAQALINHGDEVIIPAPYWVSYPDIVLIAGGTPVPITTTVEQNFKITPEQLTAAITPKTRLVVFNSPSNPTGVAYSKAELAALADVLLKHPSIMIATDDMYEHIQWTDESFANIVNACPELYDRTVVLNGVSKAYAMTGWRIGYAGGPATLINAMKTIQSQSTSNPAAVSQMAAKAALDGDQKHAYDMVAVFKERHDYIYERLQAMPGVRCTPADGAFYIFPNVEDIIAQKNVKNDADLAETLLNETGIALVPGSAFGSPGCLRISFAVSMDTLTEALDRFEMFIQS